MLSASVASTVLYGRVPDYPGILNATSDPTSGPNTPHYEVIFGVWLFIVRLPWYTNL